MRRWLLSCAVSFVCIYVAANTEAANEWRPSLTQIDGGVVRSIAATAERLYAGTWGDGVFISTDEAATWAAAGLPGEFVVSMAAPPGADGLAYAGTLDGLYRTSGAGAVWTALGVGGVVRACAVDPTDHAVAYVGVDGLGVLRTDDDGGDWNVVGDLPRSALVFGLAVDWETPARVYAATMQGLYVSDTRGDAWVSVAHPFGRLAKVSVHPTDADTVFVTESGVGISRSLDRGETWEQVLNPDLRRWLYQLVNSIAYDRNDPSTMYVGTFGAGVLRSRNAGDSWEILPTRNGWVQDLAVDPATNRIYAGISGDGVYRKVDQGGRWERASKGLRNSHVKTVRVDPSRPNTVYAATWGGGVYRSEDAAATWTPASDGLTTLVLPDFTIHPTNPDRLYAGTDGGGVYRSDDQGRHWAPMRQGLVAGIIVAVDVDPTDSDVVYAGSEGIGIRRSLDQGTTWAPTGLEEGALWAIAISPADPDIMLAGSWGFVRFGADGRGILRSDDRGATWDFVHQGAPAVSLEFDPTDHSVVYAGLFGGGVYKSEDAGITWSPVSVGLRNNNVWEVAPDPTTPGHVYAATWGAGVFVTTDGGDRWAGMNRGLESRNVYSVTLDPSDALNVYAGTTGGVYRLRRSPSEPLDVKEGAGVLHTAWGAIKGDAGLLPGFPNPANPEMWIPYALKFSSDARVDIMTSTGALVRSFDLGRVAAGVYCEQHTALRWDGTDARGEAVASGTYFVTLRAGTTTDTRRVILAR